MPNQEGFGFTLCVYSHRALPPQRSEFNDLTKAERAYDKAKGKAILFETRPAGDGLGWKKVKEKACK